MKAWLKGGLIGAGVGLVITIILIFLSRFSLGESIVTFFVVIGFPWSFIIGYILLIIFPYYGDAPLFFAGGFGGLIGIIINGFIIGAIKGLLPEQRKKLSILFSKVILIGIIIAILITSVFFLPRLWEASTGCPLKKAKSEFRIYDSQGRVTGMVNGEIKEEIPHSVYFSEYKEGWKTLPEEIMIFEPNDNYTYELFGLTKGNYDLEPSSNYEGRKIYFDAKNIPISPGETHQYHFDWKVLVEGKEGATILIDEDNDGLFEKNITSNIELTCGKFLIKVGRGSRFSQIFWELFYIIILMIITIFIVIISKKIIKFKINKQKENEI